MYLPHKIGHMGWNCPLKSCAAIDKEKAGFEGLKTDNLKYAKSELLRIKNPLKSRFQWIFGPSGATRTPGIQLPNHPRYQLRYTRIFTFQFLNILLSVVIAVVKGDFEVLFTRREKPANARVSTDFTVSVSVCPDSGTPLPKR